MSKLVWNRELKKYIDVTDPSNLNFLNKKYKLTTCRPNNTFSRGEEVHVILETKNVPQGTSVPFSIETSSKDSEIFSQNLKGNFVIGNLDENFVSESKIILNVSNKNLSTRKEIALLKLDKSKEKISITLDFSQLIPVVEETVVEETVVEEPVVEETVVEEPVVEEPVVEETVVEEPVVEETVVEETVVEEPVVEETVVEETVVEETVVRNENARWNFNKNRNHKNKNRK